MKKITVMFLTASLLLLTLATFSIAGNQPEKVRVFLEFEGKPDSGIVRLYGGEVLHNYNILENVLAVEVPVTALNGLLFNPNVVGFEFDAKVQALGKPEKCSPWPECNNGGEEDPTPPPQELPWGVDRIDADLTDATGFGATVCVVDTGVDKDHPDLQVAGGKNFVAKGRFADPNKWDDDNGHGTHVAGTVAALDNTLGVVGVAPQTSLLAAKVLDRRGSGYLSDVIAGIDYCVSSGADVVSMSLGTSSDVQTMHDAVDAAYANDVLLVAAAGNDYGGAVSFPAAYDSVVAVSATDSSDGVASFSSVGPEVELSAPGVSILSTWNDGGYNTISGTSMAAPHVSGVAALAVQLNPSFSNAEIRALLQNTADELGAVGRDDLYGYGLVDAELQ